MVNIIPPTFLPMFVTGYLVFRNMKKRRPYRGPARVSTAATPSRVSSPGGMDGERLTVRGWHGAPGGPAAFQARNGRVAIRR